MPKWGRRLETQQKRKEPTCTPACKPQPAQDGAFSASAEILFGKKQKTGRGNGRECHGKGQGQLAGATAHPAALCCSSQLGRVEERMLWEIGGQAVASDLRRFSKVPEEAIFSKSGGHAAFLTSKRNLPEIAKIHQVSLKREISKPPEHSSVVIL